MVLDICLISKEVTKPALLVFGEISILRIILAIDSLFKFGQVLDVHEVFVKVSMSPETMGCV